MLRRSPSTNRMTVRLIMRNSTAFRSMRPSSRSVNEKTSDTPTMKRKEGKTVSAKVQPFQAACSREEKIAPSSPRQLARIIRDIVRPRKASREDSRSFFGAMSKLVGARDAGLLIELSILKFSFIPIVQARNKGFLTQDKLSKDPANRAENGSYTGCGCGMISKTF